MCLNVHGPLQQAFIIEGFSRTSMLLDACFRYIFIQFRHPRLDMQEVGSRQKPKTIQSNLFLIKCKKCIICSIKNTDSFNFKNVVTTPHQYECMISSCVWSTSRQGRHRCEIRLLSSFSLLRIIHYPSAFLSQPHPAPFVSARVVQQVTGEFIPAINHSLSLMALARLLICLHPSTALAARSVKPLTTAIL